MQIQVRICFSLLSLPLLNQRSVFFCVKDKARKDTIRPAVVGTGTSRIFTLQINNTNIRDTLVMKIATNPDDAIIYEVKKGDGPSDQSTGCCISNPAFETSVAILVNSVG